MLVLLARIKTVHKFSLHVNEGRKGCRDVEDGCPDCQSAMLPILDLGGMIGLFSLRGLFVFLFLFCFLRTGSRSIALASLGLMIYTRLFSNSNCLLGLKACATKPGQRSVFAATLRHQRLTGHVGSNL